MNSKEIIEKLFTIAVKQQKIIAKLAQVKHDQDQAGTTELFFDDESKQRTFASTIQQEGGLVYKTLLAAFNKGGGNTPVSFELKAEATPQTGAKWILNTSPPNLKAAIINAINAEYQKIMGQSMAAKQKEADAKAKAGAGTGPANVGSAELNP